MKIPIRTKHRLDSSTTRKRYRFTNIIISFLTVYFSMWWRLKNGKKFNLMMFTKQRHNDREIKTPSKMNENDIHTRKLYASSSYKQLLNRLNNHVIKISPRILLMPQLNLNHKSITSHIIINVNRSEISETKTRNLFRRWKKWKKQHIIKLWMDHDMEYQFTHHRWVRARYLNVECLCEKD